MKNPIQIVIGIESENPVVDGGISIFLHDEGIRIDSGITFNDKTKAIAILLDAADALQHHINNGGAA